MKNMLKDTPSKDERKVKRITGVSIGFIGLLLTAGILFIILLLNSSVVSSAASASSDASIGAADTPTHDQNPNANALDAKNKPKMKDMKKETAERKTAAGRLKKALVTVPQQVATDCSVTPNGPHYFGPCPNYATSQLPTFTFTGITPTTVGNPLIERGYATDNANNVFVIVNAVLPAGTLENLQIWNQATAGGSTTPSAGNSFHAYVLRPTGTANQYTVVYDSGLLTMPALTTPGVSEVAAFTMPSVPVQANDMVGFYGNGIPLDIGVGTDIVSYPAPAAPVQGSTITLGADPFPILAQARTYSIAAIVNVGGAPIISGGIMKFVDSLPGLGPAGANNLGQYLPIAVSDTTTYPGSDYYEIALVEYREKMHSNLTPTKLRGYVQLSTAVTPGLQIPLTNPDDSSPILKPDGSQALAVDNPHYMGPVIIAQKDKPTRIKFYNLLPTGAGGDLFIPVDTTVMGSGDGPQQIGVDPNGNPIYEQYKQNRATLHLHGGRTPWISDGTPHQWITPAGEGTSYPEGVSARNVPDMWYDANGNQVPAGTPGATNDPGNGMMTFFYTNNQSARLMFYHDHSFGITRLNVYAGEAAGYLLNDPVEQGLVASGIIPAEQIPLIIQDKTFVPDNTTPITNMWGTFPSQLAFQDPTWNTTKWGGPGDLYQPHVYETLENPGDISGINAFGRWPYAPWFWPPGNVVHGPVPNPYYDGINPFEPPLNPGTPDPSYVAEAFMDTPVVNGAAYPSLTVEPKAYRFRILNAANDRFWNLQLYETRSIVSGINVTNGGSGYTSAPAVTITNAIGDTTGHGATATATVDLDPVSPTYGNVTAITLNTVGSNYTTAPNVTITGGGGTGATATAAIYTDPTEVGMVPAVLTPGFPDSWPTDGRDGGVPDPASSGPALIQIGTEGGFLPAPVVLSSQPVDWNVDAGTFDVGILNTYQLLLGPAERADVIVDFSGYEGKTLILYNDAPAPNPANDPRLNYYTGDIDQTDIGGAPTTLPGYGPNTRTIMQIKVNATAPSAPYDLAALNAAFASTGTTQGAFAASQNTIIVPEARYNSAYNANFPADPFVRIHDTSITFTPIGSTTPVTLPFEPKAIQDEQSEAYDQEYGRLSSMLGLEMRFDVVPRPPQSFMLYPFASPPVDIVKPSVYGTQIGTLDDGTQIWSITHNGVDAHPMHWHAFEVQMINRVAWDNNIRLGGLNELGWKETLIINPLQNTIVALRPIKIDVPFDVPNSIRPIDVTKPLGATLRGPPLGFQDPTAQPVVVTNHLVNFGWEYVWHCHILAHEEADLMHALILAYPPYAPSNLVANGLAGPLRVDLTWTDNSVGETNFTIQRAMDANFTIGLTNFTVAGSVQNSATGGTIGFTDTTVVANTQYFYRVMATNVVGDTTVYPAPAVGFPTMSIDSAPSDVVTVGPPAAAPTMLSATQPDPANNAPVVVNWTDDSPNVPNPPNFNAETSFTVQRSTNGGTTWINRATLPADTVTYTDPSTGPNGVRRRTTYTYRVQANNIFGSTTSTNTVSITTR